MAQGTHYFPLILAYLATLFYIVAMCTPWWYTKYYPADSNTSEDQFYDNNPNIDQHMGLFDRTNCFIDGSCITGSTIYKNNSTLQWVYTTILVLMIVGWVPWLIFIHLLHSRVGANRTPMKGRRFFMLLTALLTLLLITAAIIVFAVGMVKGNGVYNAGGLYGHLNVLGNGNYVGTGNNDLDYDHINKRQEVIGSSADETSTSSSSTSTTGDNSNNAVGSAFGYVAGDSSNPYIDPVIWGTLPYGNSNSRLLGAGMSVILNTNVAGINGALRYKYGPNSAWYAAILTLPLIIAALLIGLCVKTETRKTTRTDTVVSSQRGYVAPVAAPVEQHELNYMGSAAAPVLRDSTPLTRRVGSSYTATE